MSSNTAATTMKRSYSAFTPPSSASRSPYASFFDLEQKFKGMFRCYGCQSTSSNLITGAEAQAPTETETQTQTRTQTRTVANPQAISDTNTNTSANTPQRSIVVIENINTCEYELELDDTSHSHHTGNHTHTHTHILYPQRLLYFCTTKYSTQTISLCYLPRYTPLICHPSKLPPSLLQWRLLRYHRPQ
mmetsp:Transcript_1964/g.3973  ORF Transcript_1964/g.3973 Transcript_1964/m.3973 type:complete len:189 (-) Transcript_1964:507-1073(-)